MHASRGFTLIELLVVVVIIAIVAATAVLSGVGSDRARVVQTEAQRLAQLVEMARDEAVLRNRELGLQVREGSYRFMYFDVSDQRWHALEQRPFQERTLENVILVLDVEQRGRPVATTRNDRSEPQIVIFSSGEQTPFAIEVRPTGIRTASWHVASDGLSRTAARVASDDALRATWVSPPPLASVRTAFTSRLR
jgi:general secretion pathway protein H